ncbi:MAG: DUF356 domain-containing protein [Methanobrevibacter sp.]
MALILIRGENNSKVLNAISDVEKHGGLHLTSKPRALDANIADNIVSKILKADIKNESKVAAVFSIQENPTLAISKIRSIHPPAHIIVVSDEYDEIYDDLLNKMDEAKYFEGYYSAKAKNTKTIDYKKMPKKPKL